MPSKLLAKGENLVDLGEVRCAARGGCSRTPVSCGAVLSGLRPRYLGIKLISRALRTHKALQNGHMNQSADHRLTWNESAAL